MTTIKVDKIISGSETTTTLGDSEIHLLFCAAGVTFE